MLMTITSLVRHVIGLAIGGFVTDGLLSGEQFDIIVNSAVAIVSVAGLVIWSYFEKKFLTKK